MRNLKKTLSARFPHAWKHLVTARWAVQDWLAHNTRWETWRRRFLGGKIKFQSESDYWKGFLERATADCSTGEEKKAALLRVSMEDSFPRYCKYLHCEGDAFAGLKVLDVGCGPCTGLSGFTGCEMYGADHLIDEYKRLGFPMDDHGVTYIDSKAEDMPFDEDFFDVVMCVNALDHVDNLKACIREIARVMKPGGRFMGQFNFHTRPTPTEPICLSHEKILKYATACALRPRKVLYQYYHEGMKEDRYYYEFEKVVREL